MTLEQTIKQVRIYSPGACAVQVVTRPHRPGIDQWGPERGEWNIRADSSPMAETIGVGPNIDRAWGNALETAGAMADERLDS